MEVTTKELRIHPGKILDHVLNGNDVTVTYRGKRLARIVPIDRGEAKGVDEGVFGMWADHENALSVEQAVRGLRRGRHS